MTIASLKSGQNATVTRGKSLPPMISAPHCPATNPPRSRQFRYISGAEPNATFRVGGDGETGVFKGLTLSNSSPVLVGSRGFFFESRPRRIGVEKADMSTTRTRFTFRVAMLPPRPPKPPPPRAATTASRRIARTPDALRWRVQQDVIVVVEGLQPRRRIG